MNGKTWFITGASRGFGREWAKAALDRGDRVAATARSISTLDELQHEYGAALLSIELDVNDRDADFAAIRRAHEHFGQLDVVVNNAGYGQFGFVEELSESQVRDQMETNFFGALWITQAAMPYLREQGSGHIIQVSSIVGVISVPYLGIYEASKWALEGLSQALAQEVAPFGIHVTLIEPSGFTTDWDGASSKFADALPAYSAAKEAFDQANGIRLAARGDARTTAAALMKVADAQNPPLRAFFGVGTLEYARSEYASRLKNWEEWEPIAKLAQG